jgi:hypothetical protein
MCERCDLLGQRVLTVYGVRGKVITLADDGSVEVRNELENNEYAYWFRPSEIQERLPFTEGSAGDPKIRNEREVNVHHTVSTRGHRQA